MNFSMEQILDSMDRAARDCGTSLEACKTFCTSSEHFFMKRAAFFQRYWLPIIALVNFIEADLRAATLMFQPGQPEFEKHYGLSTSHYYDFRKLRDNPFLQELARKGELTSSYLRGYSASQEAHAPPPAVEPLAGATRQMLDSLMVSAAASDQQALALNPRGLRLGMPGLVERAPQSFIADIKHQLAETMAPEGLGSVEFKQCKKFNKQKGELFDELASLFKWVPTIILYHGTTAAFAEKICTDGPLIKYSSADNGGSQRVFFATSNPAVADASCSDEINSVTQVATPVKGTQASSGGAGEEETKEGQDGPVMLRTMVAFKVLLIGGSGIRPSGCTGNTWKFPANALPLLRPIYRITYEWKKPGWVSNRLRSTFPQGFDGKNTLEKAPNHLLIKHMLKGAVFTRGVASPEFLAYVFGQAA